MPRPLMQQKIDELETLFARSEGDHRVLKQLEQELKHRQVPRAVALLAKVHAAMRGETSLASSVSASASAPSHRSARVPDPPTTAITSAMALPDAATSGRPSEVSATAAPTREPLQTMPLEDAYRLLKTTAGSTWESIEQTRRALVQNSHPQKLKSMSPERQAQALAEAKRVNAAYAAMSQARCAGR